MSTIWVTTKDNKASPILVSLANNKTMDDIHSILSNKEFLMITGDSITLIVRCSDVTSVVLNKDD